MYASCFAAVSEASFKGSSPSKPPQLKGTIQNFRIPSGVCQCEWFLGAKCIQTKEEEQQKEESKNQMFALLLHPSSFYWRHSQAVLESSIHVCKPSWMLHIIRGAMRSDIACMESTKPTKLAQHAGVCFFPGEDYSREDLNFVSLESLVFLGAATHGSPLVTWN